MDAQRAQRPSDGPALSPLVDTLLFSPAGVFYDDSQFVRWLVQQLNRLGVQASLASFACLLHREALRAAYVGQMGFGPALGRLLTEIGLTRAQRAEIELACQSRARQCDEQLRLLPGVASAIEQLSASGVRMAIVVNAFDVEQQVARRLERFGLAPHFTAVYASCELGEALPEPSAFVAALQRLGRPAATVGFVSSCPLELHAAADLRFPAIGLNCALDRPEVREIGRLSDLLSVIEHRRWRLAA